MKTPAVPRAQGDGSSEPLNRAEPPHPSDATPGAQPESADDHLGATEDQVSDTSPPAGDIYKDEPKQG
jgi:hypothetical protein